MMMAHQTSSLPPESHPNPSPPLRIAFIHPDLGIGGAERLVVDAAIGLKRLGHSVQIFTSSLDPNRCFSESIDGSLSVIQLGHRLFPRSINNRFITICAILRQFDLSLNLILSFILPARLPYSRQPFDVYFIDQLSASIPLLRYGSRTRVLFYCHFPDLLLSSPTKPSDSNPWIPKLKSIYRIPLDWLEEYTTGKADTILVNSQFTADVFRQTFTSIDKIPKCVYPGVDIHRYDRSADRTHPEAVKSPIHSTRPTILSINRFEEKKDIKLVLEAFIQLRARINSNDSTSHSTLPRLVLAGGYDERLVDNRKTLKALHDIIPNHLTHATLANNDEEQFDSPDVLFLLNVSQDNKLALLNARSTKLLAYTASNEHLGIGPLEGMACRLPVVAVDSGGPKETISDGITGFLIPPESTSWSQTMERVLSMDDHEHQQMGAAGRERVIKLFSTDVMVKQLEQTILELVQPGRSTHIWLEAGFYQLTAVFVLPILAIGIALWKMM